jgi:hypothetical protein
MAIDRVSILAMFLTKWIPPRRKNCATEARPAGGSELADGSSRRLVAMRTPLRQRSLAGQRRRWHQEHCAIMMPTWPR